MSMMRDIAVRSNRNGRLDADSAVFDETSADRLPPVVALVGIDGSGKSTTAELVRRLLAPHCAMVTCLRNHHSVDAPLQSLSRALERLSRHADTIGSERLKLVAVYLQLCMYGPTTRFVAHATAPTVIISDRDPIIDAAVYLPLLRTAVSDSDDIDRLERWWERADTGERELIEDWAAAQRRRLGIEADLVATSDELVAVLGLPVNLLIEQIADRIQSELPQLLIWLDADVDQAVQRIARRGGPARPHETGTRLEAIRGRYQHVLAEASALVPTYRIPMAETRPEAVARQVIELIEVEL
ncbi:hypothetical protein [Nocardia asteroides]|uniref:hypothetical protein n=1 Tax=Nocardia asteroides TaxID=1824 RepID=UPI0036607DD8